MKFPLKYILTALLAMLFAQDCFSNAHHYEIIHYTKKDGLISDNTFQAEQDNEGYIWIVTAKGISRFNGKRFINYTTQNGLPENAIFGAFSLDSGMLFTPLLNKFTLFNNGQFRKVLSEINNKSRNYIFETYDNFLYISDGPNKTFKIYKNLSPYKEINFKHPISFVYKSDLNTKEIMVYTYNNDSTMPRKYNFNRLGIAECTNLFIYRISNNILIPSPEIDDKFYYFFALQNERNALCYLKNKQLILHPLFLKNKVSVKSILSIGDSIQSLTTNKGIYFLNHYTNMITT